MGKKKAEDILSEDRQLGKNPAGSVQDKQETLARSITVIVKNVRNESLSKEESLLLWDQIFDKTRGRKGRKFSLPKNLVALFFLFAIGLVLYFYYVPKRGNDIQQAAIINQKYLSKSDNVQLIDADKKTQILKDDSPVVYSELNELEDSPSDLPDDKVRYSSIGVPYGKRSEVMLEDGTKVWLNAGSSLTFPEKFDRKREVYLEGEAYFEISKDASRPFFVLSEVMKVEVLGTTFNLSCYADDDYASLVLLTGKVALLPSKDRSFERQLLKPGMEARLKKSQQKLLIQPTSERSISWTHRRLILSSMNLSEILKKLERFYNTKIEISESSMIGETFSGSLDLTQTLPEVLQNVLDGSKYTIDQIGRRIHIHRK